MFHFCQTSFIMDERVRYVPMSHGPGTVAETGTRARTRRAILDAAIALLTQNSAASLGDIATAADVGRTTVHRYFPERADLFDALAVDALDKIAVATDRARLDDGTGAEALNRLLQEYYEFGDVFMLFFTVPALIASDAWDVDTDADRTLLGVVERGHEDGTVDRELEPRWVQELVWCLLFSAWQHARSDSGTKHNALSLSLRSLAKVLAP